jgi:hypothetical protein
VPGDRAEDRAAGRRARQEPAANRREREQRDDQPGRQPDAAAEDAADARRRLVLLDDLDLAVLAALDDGRVVGVDQVDLRVELLHELVVGLGVGDVVVDADERDQRVDCHRFLSRCRGRPRWSAGHG